ncbi:hypothetical protein KBH77_01330 [Patescibacteria group bacterium]|nr:hypothetical protein [Patescibacteria group bacterium]
MKKIIFRAINGGGSYTISVEGDKESWGLLNQKVVFDYEADAIARDAKKEGYKIE